MYPVSERFLLAVAESNMKRVSTLQLVIAGADVGEPIPTESAEVGIRLDSATRRDISFAAVDEIGSLWPAGGEASFSPWGAEVRVRTGFEWDDGTVETVPLGVFRLTRMAEDSPKGRITTTGSDRSVNVRPGAPAPYVLAGGQRIDQAIEKGLRNRYPAAVFSAVESPWTIPPLILAYGEDHWAKLRDLAASGGHDLAVDANGEFQLRDTPEDDTRILVYREGKGNVAFDVVRELDADPEQVPNGIIVEGTNSRLEADVIGEAWDMDPASPTRRDGPYGNHARAESDDRVLDRLQANAAARVLLGRALGGQQRLSFSAPCNPAHDVGDVIRVVYPSRGIDAEYVIDSLDVSTDPGEPMRVGCRRRIAT